MRSTGGRGGPSAAGEGRRATTRRVRLQLEGRARNFDMRPVEVRRSRRACSSRSMSLHLTYMLAVGIGRARRLQLRPVQGRHYILLCKTDSLSAEESYSIQNRRSSGQRRCRITGKEQPHRITTRVQLEPDA